MSKSRFDLEQDILSFSHCVEDLRFIVESLDKQQEPLDVKDTKDLSSTVRAIAILLDLKINKTFDTFSEVFKVDKYKETDAR